jgi:hypothetical protein
MIPALIDTHALLKMLYASLAAGVGVAIVFSIAIFGAVRSSDSRRAQRGAAATAYAVMAGVGLLASCAIVVYGLTLVAHKS